MSADYTTVGHVTVDMVPDGTRRPGGTALYSALQASRLGLSARIVTRGVPAEIEALLEPFAAEIELQVEEASATTTLQTSGEGSARHQRVLAWAGPLSRLPAPGGEIVHFAPVAAELPFATVPAAGLRGLTPQGLVRRWSERRPEVVVGAAPASAIELARCCEAVVLSELELTGCRQLVEAATAAGAVVAVTAGAGATTVSAGEAASQRVAVEPLANPVDDLGAGDVYAAAFFIALREGAEPARAAAFAGSAAAERMLGLGPHAIAGRAAIEARLDRSG